jgi:outer membrane protein assembly factor BamB
VRWKAALPGPGNSTPIVWGDRILLTQSTDAGTKRSLLCLGRADGRLLWQQDVAYEGREPTHKTNPHSAASPVTDGERVIVSHGAAGMFCYDLTGRELWKRDLGRPEHMWGSGSSPIIHRDLAMLWCGAGDRQFLLAVDKRTGEDRWRVDVPGGDAKKFIGSWSTPVVVTVGDHDELILGVPRQLKGFDPATGKELWSCDGLGDLVYTSALYADGIAVAMSGYGGPALAIRLGGRGDITRDRLWHHPKNIQRIGSGVISDGHIYLLEENGVPRCFELMTGREVWNVAKRPPGGTSWSSLVLAEGRLFVSNQAGDTLVFAASPVYAHLGTNRLDDFCNASPVPGDGEWFLRTSAHLWCIGTGK